jgi:hypothetical protein
VYRTAAVACGTDGPRKLAKVSYLADGPVWVDVETVDFEGAINVRATRLVRALNQRLSDGTSAVAPGTPAGSLTRWTVDDVIELSAALPEDGVQAALSETPTTFRLNAKALTAMADGGVGDRVIDLMVGLTYPNRFVVQRATSGGGGGPFGFGMGSFMSDPFFAPLLGPAAMFSCYAPYGWAASAYWNNCAAYDPLMYARYPGFYSGFWDPYQTPWVQTNGGVVGGAAVPAEPRTEGRLVNGRGYTQVQPIDPTPINMGGNGDGYSGTSASGSAGSGSSGSSGVSAGGYSGGGMSGGGGGDRMAVPRPPGQ